jgi:hypothetical protein
LIDNGKSQWWHRLDPARGDVIVADFDSACALVAERKESSAKWASEPDPWEDDRLRTRRFFEALAGVSEPKMEPTFGELSEAFGELDRIRSRDYGAVGLFLVKLGRALISREDKKLRKENETFRAVLSDVRQLVIAELAQMKDAQVASASSAPLDVAIETPPSGRADRNQRRRR